MKGRDCQKEWQGIEKSADRFRGREKGELEVRQRARQRYGHGQRKEGL